MTKIYLFSTIVILLLGGILSSSAQQVLIEHNSGTTNSGVKHQRNFDKNNYTKIADENGKTIYLQNKSSTENNPENTNATNNVTLSVNLNYEAFEFIPWMVLIYDEFGFVQFEMWQGSNTIPVDLPAGTYDIQVEFIPLFGGPPHLIIKEEQIVQENTTVELNPAEAVNFVSITTLDENGNVLTPGVANPTTGSPSTMYFDRSVYFNPVNSSMSGVSFVRNEPFEGEGSAWNFYINDVSDRYTIFQTLVGWGYDQGNYFTKYESLLGVQESVSLENNPDAWTLHTEQFQQSSLGANTDVSFGAITSTLFNQRLLSGWSISSTLAINPEEDSFKAYLDNSFDDNPIDFLVSPSIVDHKDIIDPDWGTESFFIKGNPILADGNGGVLYGSGDMTFGNLRLPSLAQDYYAVENSSSKVLPFHPKFTFTTSSAIAVKQGNNVPITVTGFNVVPNESNTFRTSNIGRYGENRESDFFATQLEAKQNGSVIFSGSYLDFLGFYLPTSGQIELTLTNNNTVIDGITGENITKITYDADEEDAPPTLQHLQFRNSDNDVTSVFDSSENATVRIAAGDFKFNNIDGMGGYYEYEAGNNIELFYSIHDQNDWLELELIEYPEYFQMPAFGDYYEASLSNIAVASEDLWYDIKVVLTDAGGNKQEQKISPVFKINHSLGIEDMVDSKFSVYPNPFSEELNILLPEDLNGNYIFKITDITGRTVYTKNQNGKSFSWNSSSLSQGFYILSIENNGKSISKKVIKI